MGLLISSWTLDRASQKYYNETNLPNIWVSADKITASDEDFFAEYFNYDKRLFLSEKITSNNEEYKSNIYVSDGYLATPYIETGSEHGGCYIDKNDARKHGLSINYSSIKIPYNYDGKTYDLTFTVNGTCSISEDMVLDDKITIFIDEELFLNELKAKLVNEYDTNLVKLEYNQILIEAENITEVKQKINDYYLESDSNLIGIKTIEDNYSVNKIKDEIKQLKIISFTLPVLFLVIATMVVVSTISQLVYSDKYNIGLLKSLGISTKKVLFNYSGYGVVFCFIGAVLGLLISPFIVPNIAFLEYDKLYSIPSEYVVLKNPIWLNVIVAIVISIIGFISAFYASLKLIKKSPIECMRYNAKIKIKSRNKRNKLPKLLKMPMRNVKINKVRTAISVISIAGCLLLYMIGEAVNDGYYLSDKSLNISSIKLFSEIFRIFAIILLVLSLIILVVQIFKERIKEMALLRLHGENHIKIWLSLLFEIIFVVTLALLLAFILLQPCLLILSNISAINFVIIADFMCYFSAVLFVIFGVALIALACIPRVYKLSLVDVLKNEE